MELTPEPHQDEFIFSEKPFLCLDGGFGNGKSTAGMLKMGIHCLNNPGTKAGIFREDYADIRKSTLEDWNELWGDMGTYNHQTHLFTFHGCESKVLFNQLSSTDKLKNINLSAALIEQGEETVEDSFQYLRGRIRRKDTDNSQLGFRVNGKIVQRSMADRWLGVLSNPEGHDWIWKLFIQKDLSESMSQTARKRASEFELETPSEDDFHYISASTYENIDNLDKQYLQDLLTLPEHLYERYVEGSRDTFEGKIYTQLQEKYHRIPPFRLPEAWPKYLLVDHAETNKTAGVWVAMDYDQNAYVYREHYKRKGDEGKEWVISQHVNRMEKPMKDADDDVCPYRETPTNRFCDPAMFNKTREKNGQHISVAEEYAENGMVLNPWQRAGGSGESKLAQINRVSEHLMLDEEREHPVHDEPPSPQFFFFENCKHSWETMNQYRWKEQARSMVGRKNNPERPRKYKDHIPNCIEGFYSMKRTVAQIKKKAPKWSFENLKKRVKKRKRRDRGGNFAAFH